MGRVWPKLYPLVFWPGHSVDLVSCPPRGLRLHHPRQKHKAKRARRSPQAVPPHAPERAREKVGESLANCKGGDLGVVPQDSHIGNVTILEGAETVLGRSRAEVGRIRLKPGDLGRSLIVAPPSSRNVHQRSVQVWGGTWGADRGPRLSRERLRAQECRRSTGVGRKCWRSVARVRCSSRHKGW